MKNTPDRRCQSLLSAVSFCFSLLENFSFYTALRLCRTFSLPVIGIVTAWLGKMSADMLSGAQLGGSGGFALAAAMLALRCCAGGAKRPDVRPIHA